MGRCGRGVGSRERGGGDVSEPDGRALDGAAAGGAGMRMGMTPGGRGWTSGRIGAAGQDWKGKGMFRRRVWCGAGWLLLATSTARRSARVS